MFKIAISDETADSLVRDILSDDYLRLKQDIEALERKGDLESYEQIDLENNRRYVAALVVILEYYLPQQEYDRLHTL
jgi:hypothetical protein